MIKKLKALFFIVKLEQFQHTIKNSVVAILKKFEKIVMHDCLLGKN